MITSQPVRSAILTLVVATLATFTFAATVNADEVSDLTAKAEKGDAKAQFQLGQKYSAGNGIPKDEAAALKWFLKSAEQDNAGAEVSLGSIYSHGFGVKQDWAESIRWFRKAALQGDKIALHNLGLDYNYGHGVKQDYAQAANYYRLGADQGQARCQYNLALLYEEGHGVTQSDADACFFYSLAADHEDPNHIFGEAKAKEVIEHRDKLLKKLTPAQLEAMPQRVKAYQMLAAINPRKFGTENTGASRGFWIWKSFNSETWEAVVGRENTDETWKARVLPWSSTYRYLTYGVSPALLLPGERVNVFFDADETNRRGYVTHFQDEICQMVGHGHYWQISKADKDGVHFTAHVMAGDKVFQPAEQEFAIDPACAKWKNGSRSEQLALAENDHVYLTWCMRDGKRVVMLISDKASIDVIKKEAAEREAKDVAATGLMGQLQSIEGDTLHFMAFSNAWSQANKLKEGQIVRLSATGKGYLPTGPTIEAKITFRKNRGTYGSGVNDMLLQLVKPADAETARPWLDRQVLRIFAQVP